MYGALYKFLLGKSKERSVGRLDNKPLYAGRTSMPNRITSSRAMILSYSAPAHRSPRQQQRWRENPWISTIADVPLETLHLFAKAFLPRNVRYDTG